MMKSSGMNFKIESEPNNYLFIEGIGEFLFLVIMYIIQLFITKKFDWIVLLVFGICFVVLLIFSFLIWLPSKLPYVKINTLKDEIIIRKFIKKKEYKISELNFKALIEVDNEVQFIYKLMIYKNEKKLIHIYSTGIKNPTYRGKEFYNLLRTHLKIELISKKDKRDL